MAGLIVAWNVAAAEQRLLNGIAAVVNDRVITAEEVEIFAEPGLRAAARQFLGRPAEEWEKRELEIKRSVLEELINRQLILAEFNTKGYAMPESLVDDIVKDEIRKKFRDRLTLTKELQARNQTYEDYRKQVKEDFIVANMRSRNVNQQIIISPKKIEGFYEANRERFKVTDQVKLRMILLTKARRPGGEARRLADEIVTKARGGAGFDELANTFSEDAQRFKGGDRGWIENTDSYLRKELRDVTFQLQPGQVSDPVELDTAVFVMKVEDRKAAGIRPLADVRQEIEGTLRGQEFDRLVSNWMKRLREKSYTRYF